MLSICSALSLLSNGQRQCLSLAYIDAISKVSGKLPPIVVDMPVGRLDGEVRALILSAMCSRGSQCILLMSPGTEWTDESKKDLMPRAAAVYNLVLEGGMTSVEKEV